MEASDEAWSRSRLSILNADGTLRFVIGNRLDLRSGPTPCNFVGVTEAVDGSASVFTAVAVSLTEDPFCITQRADIDAQTGILLSVRESR